MPLSQATVDHLRRLTVGAYTHDLADDVLIRAAGENFLRAAENLTVAGVLRDADLLALESFDELIGLMVYQTRPASVAKFLRSLADAC